VSPEEDRLLVAIRKFINRDLVEAPLPAIAPSRPVATVTPVAVEVQANAVQADVEQPDAVPQPRMGRARRELVCALLLPPVNVAQAVAQAVAPAAVQPTQAA